MILGTEPQKWVGQRRAFQSEEANDLRKEGFILVHGWRAQIILAGKAWWYQLEAADHVASGAREQRDGY